MRNVVVFRFPIRTHRRSVSVSGFSIGSIAVPWLIGRDWNMNYEEVIKAFIVCNRLRLSCFSLRRATTQSMSTCDHSFQKASALKLQTLSMV